MEPGDVSAREREFGAMVLDQDARQNASVLLKTNSVAYQSPYIPRSPFDEIPDFEDFALHLRDADPSALAARPDIAKALRHAANLAGTLWLMDPLEYAEALAMTQGVRRTIADSDEEVYEYNLAHDRSIRDPDMARGLGDAAINLLDDGLRSRTRTPILGFVAGSGHRGVENILASHDIPFSSSVARRPASDRLIELHMFFTRSRQASHKTFIKGHTQRWFNNLTAHGYKPVNNQLGIIRYPR